MAINPPVEKRYLFVKNWDPMKKGMVAQVLNWKQLTTRQKNKYHCRDCFGARIPFKIFRTKVFKAGVRTRPGPLWYDDKKKFWQSVICEKHFKLSDIVMKDSK